MDATIGIGELTGEGRRKSKWRNVKNLRKIPCEGRTAATMDGWLETYPPPAMQIAALGAAGQDGSHVMADVLLADTDEPPDIADDADDETGQQQSTTPPGGGSDGGV
jgi:hypothetical protein